MAISGAEVEAQLLAVAERLGAKGHICYQEEPLGTAHAILCGAACLTGPVVVAFADTLFRADFTIDPTADGVLFVKQVENPNAFGVVVTDKDGAITDYVEKPSEFVSDPRHDWHLRLPRRRTLEARTAAPH